MALQKTISFKNLTVTNAYSKVVSIFSYKENGLFYSRVKVTSHAIKDSEVLDEMFFNFVYNISAVENVFVQAYNSLKALPEFSGSVDV